MLNFGWNDVELVRGDQTLRVWAMWGWAAALQPHSKTLLRELGPERLAPIDLVYDNPGLNVSAWFGVGNDHSCEAAASAVLEHGERGVRFGHWEGPRPLPPPQWGEMPDKGWVICLAIEVIDHPLLPALRALPVLPALPVGAGPVVVE